MLSEFSPDSRYFAYLTKKKLKIWETLTNKLVQEFQPAIACSCLKFVGDDGKNNTPRKKKKRQSLEPSSVGIALGSTTGDLLFYSISKADLDFTIKSVTNQSIGCLTWSTGNVVYGGVDENIVTFNLDKQIVGSEWKSGKEKLVSILSIPKSSYLVTASHEIKLWDTSEKQLLKVFTGHNHDVTLLRYIPPTEENPAAYFLSGTKSDRNLSIWNFSDTNVIAQFALEDSPSSVSIYMHDGITNLTAVTRSGVAQIFSHIFNGKRRKPPIQPDVTIHITPETENMVTTRIPFVGATFLAGTELSLHLCYGSGKLSFENVKLINLTTQGKVLHWIRKDFSSKKKKQALVQNGHSTIESQLHNLNLNHDSKVSLSVDSLPKLLVKGLQRRENGILISLLNQFNEDVIKSTLRKLPTIEYSSLLTEISKMSMDKSLISGKGALWLKPFIKHNTELLVADTQLAGVLNSIGSNIEERVLLRSSLLRLNGKLDLLNAQISKNQEENAEDDDNFLLVNETQDDSDSDINLDGLEDTDEEKEWMEEEEELNEEEEVEDGSNSPASTETESEEDEEKLNIKKKSPKNRYQDMEID